jgi:hypothetical protein
MSTGSIQVTFSTPMSSSSYAVTITPEGLVADVPFVTDKTVDGFVLHVHQTESSSIYVEWTATPATQ